ncbi:MAG: Crp/Fnr family transcriptional regulator, partial [Reyranella sp.]|uniref:Crp/Fnr family transcriptional regulator n=1 Tax=Reyranella sp. TaxID=1929291 RepID=UPI00120F145C
SSDLLAILGPGAIVGELAMIDALPRSATVEAITDCDLAFVSGTAFKACLQDHPEIYSHLVLTLVARLRQADEEAAAASFLTVKARIARALLQFAEHLGRETDDGRIEIVHKIQQTDLASMAGVARESVSRTVSDWKRRDVIRKPLPNHYVFHKETLQREAADFLQ